MIPALLSLVLAFSSPPASAATLQFGILEQPEFDELIGPFLGNAFPTSPMKPGLKELKLVPAYLKADKSETNGPQKVTHAYDVKGFGASASYLHAFSEHWGMSFTLAYQKGEGDATMDFRNSPAGTKASTSDRADVEQSSYAGMAALVYDPMSGEGFRLPIFAGLALFGAQDTRTFSGTVAGDAVTASVETDRTGISPALGIAPQFNTGPLRWTIFGAFLGNTQTPGASATGTNQTTSASIGTQSNSAFDEAAHSVGVVGVELVYKPWGLGTVWIPPIVLENGSFTFLSLKLNKRFG